MGKAFEPYDIFWIEEPVATDDIDGSAEVARPCRWRSPATRPNTACMATAS